jgi:large subunit ribosomal protein L1
MSATDIAENIEAVLKRIESKMERGEANIASVYVKATMGEAIRIK